MILVNAQSRIFMLKSVLVVLSTLPQEGKWKCRGCQENYLAWQLKL